MKAMNWTTLALALAALPLASQEAQPRHRQAHRMDQALNLTEPQKTRIKAIRDKHQPDLLLRRQAAREARTALKAALQDATTPEANLRSLADKASAARFDLILARRTVRQEIQAVYTPEQRAKAAELRAVAQVNRRELRHHLRKATGMAG